MSIESVSRELASFKTIYDGYSKPSAYALLIAIAEYVTDVGEHAEKCATLTFEEDKSVPKDFVSLTSFMIHFPFVSDTTLTSICNYEAAFSDYCMKFNNRWYFEPHKMLLELEKKRRFKNLFSKPYIEELLFKAKADGFI